MTDTNRTEDHDTAGTVARLREGYDAAFDRTAEVTGKAIDAASEAANRAARGIEASPIGLLAGGIAVGAVLGALLPRSDREKALLGPVGTRIGSAAREAFVAAKDAGRSELEARGLTRESAQAQAKDLFQGVLKAAGSAGAAAKDSATATTSQAE